MSSCHTSITQQNASDRCSRPCQLLVPGVARPATRGRRRRAGHRQDRGGTAGRATAPPSPTSRHGPRDVVKRFVGWDSDVGTGPRGARGGRRAPTGPEPPLPRRGRIQRVAAPPPVARRGPAPQARTLMPVDQGPIALTPKQRGPPAGAAGAHRRRALAHRLSGAEPEAGSVRASSSTAALAPAAAA